MSQQDRGLSRRLMFKGVAAAGVGLASASPLISKAQAAAPLLGAGRPGYYRFKLGDFEVTTLLDGAVQVDGPHPIFGENVEAAEVRALTEKNFLPSDRMVIGFAPVIVNTGEQVIIFDSGNGAGRRPDAGRLAEMLASAGFAAGEIDIVVLSHFHPDHIGGLMEGGAPLFPNASYVANEAEYDFWSAEDKLSGPTEGVAKLTQANVVPLAEKMAFLKDGGEVVSGITAIGAGGHTPGHTAFHLESAGKRLMITADTATHYVIALQRPDWHVRFDMDKEAAAAARRQVFGMIAADRIPFSGYHMPFPALGYVDQIDQGFRYVPASYQLDL
jgi:glyoxylase-like metal-dependent hydrolase (beta-lactamase superfamily II)